MRTAILKAKIAAWLDPFCEAKDELGVQCSLPKGHPNSHVAEYSVHGNETFNWSCWYDKKTAIDAENS